MKHTPFVFFWIVASSAYADQTFTGQTKFENPTGREVFIENDNGDSTLTFHDPNNKWYSMGIDQSDGGSFKLNYGGNVGDSNHFILKNNGNVGIGMNPNATLTVKGGINMHVTASYGGEYSTDNSDYSNVLSIGGVGPETGLKIYKQNSGSQPTFVGSSSYNDAYVFEMTDGNGNDPDGGIVFGATGSDDIFEGIMYVQGTGNVGIGKKLPSHKLEVNGTIRAKEVVVENSGWPDYVFEPDYALPTLEDIDAHIREKGHLPGVPAAEEVDSAGQSLGQTQRLMMQKIEELTLYAIEKDRRVNQLESKNEMLEARLATMEAALAKLFQEQK